MPVNRDDTDERNARIDMLIEELRAKAEAVRTTAQAAKERSREIRQHARATITRAREGSTKKAG